MSTTNNPVSNLIINELTEAQYNALKQSGEINLNELYMVTDVYYPTIDSLANVAFTGEYSDLINAPAPGGDVDQTYNASSPNAQSGLAVANAISGMFQIVTNAQYANITPVNGVIYFITDSN